MSKATWEFEVEGVFIDLLRAHKALKGKKVFHHDTAAEADTNCLIVSATQGVKQLEGPKAYEGEVAVEWRGSSASPELSNAVVQAVVEVINPPTGTTVSSVPSTGRFYYFRIEDEKQTGERADSANLRRRIKTFPVVALLA